MDHGYRLLKYIRIHQSGVSFASNTSQHTRDWEIIAFASSYTSSFTTSSSLSDRDDHQPHERFYWYQAAHGGLHLCQNDTLGRAADWGWSYNSRQLRLSYMLQTHGYTDHVISFRRSYQWPSYIFACVWGTLYDHFSMHGSLAMGRWRIFFRSRFG